jgi:hypothetical protein
MENYYNPPKNISEVSDISKIFSSSDIFNYFESIKSSREYYYIKISFNGGFTYNILKSFSEFTEYLNYYQSKQAEKVFFLYENRNEFLAILETNKPFKITI